MRKRLTTIYAVFCTLLLAVGFLLVFFFAWRAGIRETVSCVVGLALGFVFAPIAHELGHVAFARLANMECVYVKCFCFRVALKNGRKRFSFASPFGADETQVLPKSGGNMLNRAGAYALGGLICEGALTAAILALAIVFSCLENTSYLCFGILPYSAYLFILNALPVEYASGKTDALVYRGIKKGCDAEKCMLSAMEIQGQLSEGKSFSQIDERYYFDLPQLCEDEPLYAVLLDLRYRYYIEKDERERAADCLNRLVLSQTYLSERETEKIAAELVYMHSLNGERERAEECGRLCKSYLSEETATAKRILAAYALAFGDTERVKALLSQAESCLKKERSLGVRKFEEILLSRIKAE